MLRSTLWLGLTLACIWDSTAAAGRAAEATFALHPDNPRYFLFREAATILVGSTEHYGAVLNCDFDYVQYLDEIARDGLNLTRTFSGVYCEQPGAFGIRDNTLAPAEGRLLCPFARSDLDGYAGGGRKFDLTEWDPAYFTRLRDFIRAAGQRGIVVEFVLFCPFYEEAMWRLSPLHSANNVNGVGQCGAHSANALEEAALTQVQLALVRKLASELNEFDNLYFEICNEPYFGGVTLEFQRAVARELAAAEQELPRQHLIAQNIANGSQRIVDPVAQASIFNFHYANPPTAVAENADLDRPLCDDETGFRGSDDAVYRREAWEFLLAGGAGFDHLDYSFTVEHPGGDATNDAPGGGSRTLRAQFGLLKRFLLQFNLPHLRPLPEAFVGDLPGESRAWVLGDPGVEYAIYAAGEGPWTLQLALSEGEYAAELVDPLSGAQARLPEQRLASGGVWEYAWPAGPVEAALRIRRQAAPR